MVQDIQNLLKNNSNLKDLWNYGTEDTTFFPYLYKYTKLIYIAYCVLFSLKIKEMKF